VDLRHHVYLPFFLSGTYDNDEATTISAYCSLTGEAPITTSSSGTTTPAGRCSQPCSVDVCKLALCGNNPYFCVDNKACSATSFGAPIYDSSCSIFNETCCPTRSNSTCGKSANSFKCCNGCQNSECPCSAGPCCDTCCDASKCGGDSFESNYINWSANWNSIDRQTNLKDMDGSLSTRATTSGKPTFIINNDVYFNGPNSETECSSLGTSLVAPYHFGRMYTVPDNWRSTESCRTNSAISKCKVLRFHRLSYSVSDNELPIPPMIGAGPKGGMGHLYQEGTSYLMELLQSPTTGVVNPSDASMAPRNQLYRLGLLYPAPYAQPNSFVIWVGPSFHITSSVQFCRFKKIGTTLMEPQSCIAKNDWTGDVANFITASVNDGFLNITLDHRAFVQSSIWLDGERERCIPAAMCAWNSTTNTCGCAASASSLSFNTALGATCEDVCSTNGGVSNSECPGGGCMGFTVRIPDVPYAPPFNDANILDYLRANRQLFRQWSSIIRQQGFKTARPPMEDIPCN
jgi:hypothetical protein